MIYITMFEYILLPSFIKSIVERIVSKRINQYDFNSIINLKTRYIAPGQYMKLK